MTYSSIVQRRWKITPEKVIIYPYGVLYLISASLAVTRSVWFAFIGYLSKDTLTIDDVLDLWPLYFIFTSVLVLLWVFVRTAIIFDRPAQMMYKKLFGLIKTTQIRFDQVQAIVPVMNVRAAYQYRVFAKNRPDNTFTIISSPYLTEQSLHAVRFQQHVLAALQQFLKLAKQ
ncbi:hypothetical protein ABDD95_20670 [Mucilaginibacter sp. PAMB04274]|uniref:hypothetical protein n=1 Tax=Mucilaginibacter sp. PAMB04274 TaxID=3138568 RepID=UPI0031F66F90